VITPIKDTGRNLTGEQKIGAEEFNRSLSRVRVTIERLFGLLKEIFPRMQYYTGGDNLSVDVDIALMFLNMYMLRHPLTSENGAMNARFISLALQSSDISKEKKRQAQKKYKEKIKQT
jgi:hypothetical protein